MFHLFVWLTIPAATYGFIAPSSCAIAISSHFLFVYRNNGKVFFRSPQHADAPLVVKDIPCDDSIGVSTTTTSAVTCVNSLSMSFLHMNLYGNEKREISIRKTPTSSTGRDVSPSSTTNIISAAIPYSWTAKSSTTQLYARGGKKRRNASNKQAKNKESSTYFIEEDTYPNQEITASSKHNRQLNRKERMEILLSQHEKQCIWCNTPINISTATTDHIIPKIKGGPSWIENELASCYKCNKARGHIPALDYIEIMKEKGFFVNQDAIFKKLQELDIAFEERGGQRKARPHLYRQLRRLERKSFDS